MMKGKTARILLGSVLPWCALIALLGYEGYLAKRRADLEKDFRKYLPTAIDEMVRDTQVYGVDDTFAIARFWSALGDTQGLSVVVNERATLLIMANEFDVPGSVSVNVYADGSFKKELLQCGTRGQKFEWYLVMHPQTGPDAGKLSYGDYDLDGTFEQKLSSSSGTRIE